MIQLEIDDRTFEQKFGTRCFCGEPWSSEKRCGGGTADYTIQQALSSLFADRVKNCEVCDRAIPADRTFCWDCSAARQRYRNAQDRHRRVTSLCQWLPCSRFFEHRADKRPATCGYRCMNLKRQHERRAHAGS